MVKNFFGRTLLHYSRFGHDERNLSKFDLKEWITKKFLFNGHINRNTQ